MQIFAQQTLFVKDLKNYPVTTPFYAKSIAKDKFESYWMLSDNKLIKFNKAGTTDFTSTYKLKLDNASFISTTNADELLIFYKGQKEYTKIDFIKNSAAQKTFSVAIDSIVHDSKSIYIFSQDRYFDFFTENEIPASAITPPKYYYNKNNIYVTAGGRLIDSIHHVFYHGGITTLQTNLTWFEISEPINDNISYYSDKRLPSFYPTSCYPFDKKIFFAFEKVSDLFVKEEDALINVLTLPINKSIYPKLSKENILHTIRLDGKRLLLLTKSSLLYTMDASTYAIQPYEPLNKLRLKFQNIAEGSDGKVFLGTTSGDVVIHKAITTDTRLIKATADNHLSEVYRLYEDKNKILWIGMIKGLAAYNTTTDELFSQHLSSTIFDKEQASAVGLDNKNRFWWGDYGSILKFCDYNKLYGNILARKRNIFENISFTNFNESHRFPSFIIRQINIADNKIVVRSKEGLAIIDDKDLSYHYVTFNNGLAEPIYSQYNHILDNKYITGVEGGYALVNIESRSPSSFPGKISFDEIYFGEKLSTNNYQLALEKTIKTTVDNPFITIKLANYFQNSFEDIYWYKVDNGPWIKAPENLATISTNKAGVYKLSLKNSSSSYHNTANQTQEITILVKTPWYESFWFYGLVFLATAAFGYYFYRLLESEKRNKAKAKQFEMVSLRSQMNPHFISNSLNSINLYVLENKSEEASSYIVKFSKLIRRILNYSEQEFISIHDEIQMVENYLDMEKLRFKDKFTYAVEYIEPVNKEYKIPSLIVQPIVENALWHGLLQNSSQGHLLIKIVQQAEAVTIIVEDNGIGRKASAALKSKMSTKQKSFGINIIKKRFELINEQSKKDYKISVADKNTDGTGTVVTLNV